MADFPQFKCGAVAQYPSDRTRTYSTGIVRFSDGTEQRFPKFKSEVKRWDIRLHLLDEAEIELIDQFFAARKGRFESFSFTDPWENVVYPNCSFAHDSASSVLEGSARGSTSLTIVENR